MYTYTERHIACSANYEADKPENKARSCIQMTLH